MKITLLRHGRPSFHLNGSVAARELPSIAKSYDDSDIEDCPPGEAIAVASEHRMVVCSDLRRSIESAVALGCAPSPGECGALFREAAIPHFERGPLVLPIQVWVVALRALWLLGFSKNGESFKKMKVRARAASSKLIGLASEHDSVLLVGHGFFNHHIAKCLLSEGWSGPRGISQGYWSFSSYEFIPTSK